MHPLNYSFFVFSFKEVIKLIKATVFVNPFEEVDAVVSTILLLFD